MIKSVLLLYSCPAARTPVKQFFLPVEPPINIFSLKTTTLHCEWWSRRWKLTSVNWGALDSSLFGGKKASFSGWVLKETDQTCWVDVSEKKICTMYQKYIYTAVQTSVSANPGIDYCLQEAKFIMEPSEQPVVFDVDDFTCISVGNEPFFHCSSIVVVVGSVW